MKNVSVAFKTELASEASNLCVCIRIIRKDGQGYGFTTWDQSFSYAFLTNPDAYGAITFIPQNTFEPSDTSSSADLSVDNLEVMGVISSPGLEASELSAGLYEGAEVTVFRVNPENLAQGEMIDKRGYIGEISFVDDKYVCEILTSSAFLRRNVGQVSSPTCRVRKFCDNQCKLTEATFSHSGAVGFVNSRDTSLVFTADVAITVAMTRFVNGLIKVSYGGFTLEREIKEVTFLGGTDYSVSIRESFGIELNGNSATLVQGCDRKFATCVSLGNAVNFRGEPHLPGTDTLSKAGRAPE